MKISVFLYILLFSFNLLAHEYHVSHTTLFYNSNTKSIEITIKVAIEDLELSILENESKKIDLEDVSESKQINKLISNYFNRHFKIFFDNILYEYSWVGKEFSDDFHDIYLYFEIRDFIHHEQEISLNNSIFNTISLNQKNIVLIDFNKNKHNLIFTNDHKNQSVYLN